MPFLGRSRPHCSLVRSENLFLTIEPFNLVNSLPGQVEDASSHLINSPSGPVEDASSHTVNFLPCQVGVYPHKSEGIEPFNLVNSPPSKVEDANVSSHTVNSPLCQVGALPPHPINSPSGSLGVSSPVSCTVPASVSDRVTPVLSLSPPVPVPNPITPRPSSVTSPSCFTSSGTASVPLNTTQATSHEQPMALPIGSHHL